MPRMPAVDPAAPVRVAVVNDYDIIVAGVASVLDPHADEVRLVEVDLRRPVVSDVDVVLTHTYGQVHPDGVRLPQALGPASAAKVLVLGFAATAETVERWFEAGAHGFLVGDHTGPRIVEAVRRVHAGEQVRPELPTDPAPPLPEGTEITKSDPAGAWPGSEHGLSPRESEVVALICQGLTNDEVADQLYLGINTVKTYIRTAYRKAGVKDRANAVLWGLDHGFAPDRSRTVVAPGPGDAPSRREAGS